MNITKQIIKKSVLVGTIALSIAVFAGCSDSANSSTADTTKPTEAQTTVQATEGTAKSGTTNESFDLKSLHTANPRPRLSAMCLQGHLRHFLCRYAMISSQTIHSSYRILYCLFY